VDVIEKIAKGMRVVDDSIQIDNAPAKAVRGLDPLVVSIGPLQPNEQKELKYKLTRA